jgi:DNA polymerase
MNTYKDILKQIGWPTDCIVLDFESYWDKDYTLSKLSIPEYVLGKQFEVMGLGTYDVAVEHSPIFVEPDELDGYLKGYKKILHDTTFVMQNAKFDAFILKHIYGLSPEYIIDIADLDRHLHARASHKLADMEKRWGVERKHTEKLINTKGKHWDELDSGEIAYFKQYTKDDAYTEGELFKLLLPKISRPEVEIPLMRHTLKMYLDYSVNVDENLGRSLILEMNERITGAVFSLAGAVKNPLAVPSQRDISSDLRFAAVMKEHLNDLGEELPVKEGKPTKNMIPITGEGLIPAFAKDDEGMKQLLKHEDDSIRILAEAKQAVNSWPGHIKRVNNILNQARARDWVLGMPLNYYSGHTGRWGGAHGINMQNLPNLLSDVKSMIVAPDGYIFIIVDEAQIEARYLAHIAGQHDLLQQFASGVDIYSDFASELLQKPVRKPYKDDPPQLKKILKTRRQFGKIAILGLGYGMGWKTLFSQMADEPVLYELIQAGNIDEQFAEKVVNLYRTKYRRIPSFWNDIEAEFRYAAKYHGEEYDSKYIQGFKSRKGMVEMVLPSGRSMYYHETTRPINKYDKLKWKYGYLHGGVITENIVQAACRDIIAEMVLQIDHYFPVVLHRHDDIVVCVEDKPETIECAKNLVTSVMTRDKGWYAGIPLEIELEVTKVLT